MSNTPEVSNTPEPEKIADGEVFIDGRWMTLGEVRAAVLGSDDVSRVDSPHVPLSGARARAEAERRGWGNQHG